MTAASPHPTSTSDFLSFRQKFTSKLTFATLCYLLLPNLLFVLSWLQIPLAIVLGLACLGAVFFAAKSLFTRVSPEPNGADSPLEEDEIRSAKELWRQIGSVFLPLCAFVCVSGVGGFGYQSSDWEKHNSILRDLIAFPWPVQYNSTGFEGVSLIYYFAYYLPAALIGKIAGWDAANFALIAWTLGGFFLLSVWIALFVGKRVWWIGAVLLAFGSYDWLAFQIHNLVSFTRIRYGLGMSPEYVWHMEQTWKWLFSPEGGSYAPILQGLRLEYTSLINAIVYVPQHALAAWLATSVLLRRGFPFVPSWRSAELARASEQTASDRALDWFVVCLTPLWSAFVFVGCFPLLAFNEWQRRSLSRAANASQNKVFAWRNALFVGVAGTLILGVVALFFIGKQSDGLHGLRFVPAIVLEQGSLVVDGLKAGLFSLFFWMIQAVILWCFFQMFPAQMAPFKGLFWLCVAVLALTPLLSYGSNNDWTMRVSMPALFAFRLLFLYGCVLLFRRFWQRPQSRLAKLCAVGIGVQMLCSLMLPVGHLAKNFEGWYNRPAFENVPRVINLYDSKKMLPVREFLLPQYLGKPDPRVFRQSEEAR